MPVYVYKNLKTNETFEVTQRMTEAALTQHPETGDPVKRLIQPVGIAFKGSGFYVNDSRSSSNASSAKSTASKSETTSTDSSSSASESSTKTESSTSTSSASESSKATTKKITSTSAA